MKPPRLPSLRRWGVLEVRDGQGDRLVSKHFSRRTAEANMLLAAQAWQNLRGEIAAGRAVWDWTLARPIRLTEKVCALHPDYVRRGGGSLWPGTEYYAVQLPMPARDA